MSSQEEQEVQELSEAQIVDNAFAINTAPDSEDDPSDDETFEKSSKPLYPENDGFRGEIHAGRKDFADYDVTDCVPDNKSLITLGKNEEVKLMQPVPLSDSHTKHPLWCRWALWYDSTSKKTTRKNWSDNLKEVHSFDTGEDFWSVYNNIHSPSQLGHGSNYHLFKHGIKPMWEHEANKRGGKWIVHVNRRYKDKLDTAWLYLSMALIGECFEEGDEICGGVVSVRKNGDRISVWTRSAREAEVCNNIGNQFQHLLNTCIPDARLVYQAHSEALQNDSSFGNQPLYYVNSARTMSTYASLSSSAAK